LGLKIHSRGHLSIPHGVCNQKNILPRGINISPGYLFDGVKEILLGLKLVLGDIHQSYMEFAF
jgi:hypothetical protein